MDRKIIQNEIETALNCLEERITQANLQVILNENLSQEASTDEVEDVADALWVELARYILRLRSCFDEFFNH